MGKEVPSKLEISEQFNQLTKDLWGAHPSLAPTDPMEVDHIIYLVGEWAELKKVCPAEGPPPPDRIWEDSVFPPLIKMISANLERFGVDMSKFQTSEDCLHPPIIEYSGIPERLLTVDHYDPCRLLLGMLLKCYLARDPWTLSKDSIAELRSGLMELGFAFLSGVLLKAEDVLKSAVRQADKEANAVKMRGDQLDKAAFQDWIKEEGITVSKIDQLRDLKKVPDVIARILRPVDSGGRAESTIKDWYKEVRPRTLKGGRPKKIHSRPR